MDINNFIASVKTDPVSTLKLIKNSQDIENIIKYLSDWYYNKNESLISDQLFDVITEFYELHFKKKMVIGANYNDQGDGLKVKLPIYMGSLDKIKPSSKIFNKWINKYPGPYILSFKLDGISALLYKKNSKIYFYTRGDGFYGQDITRHIKYLNINTSKLLEDDAIRGELIMSKENFKKIANECTNPRSTVSGLINAKKSNIELLKLVDFVAYWTISPELISSDQLKYIETKEFVPRSVDYVIKNKITLNEPSEMLLEGRKNHKYEIDGIVVIDNSKIYNQEVGTNPAHGFAFKQVLMDQMCEATVIDVIWKISGTKYIKPKIQIDPIELLGSTIEFATAHNAKYISDNNIGPGSVIIIVKSGDVIPYIHEILKPSETGKPKMPSIEYEWNETCVDIIAINLTEETSQQVVIRNLTTFFSSLDIKFISESTITKLVSAGFDDLWKILTADKKQLYDIEGLGKKSINRIFDSIDNGLINRELYEIMGASQAFGRGFGKTKVKLITDVHPNIVDMYTNTNKTDIAKLVSVIHGFDKKSVNRFVDGLNDWIIFYDKLILLKPNVIKKILPHTNIKINDPATSKYNLLDFVNKKIVFTGFRDNELQKEFEKFGCIFSTSVSSNTDYLIALSADINQDIKKNKIADAITINNSPKYTKKIIIMSKEEFYKKITK